MKEMVFEDTVEDIKGQITKNLSCFQGKFPAVATKNDYYLALAHTARERLMHRWIRTAETYFKNESRTVVYLSAEFLIGPQLGKNLLNSGIYEQASQAVRELGLSLEDLLEQEEEPGLGNGGLGRLAACFMDSLATLQIPAIGYGIRYEFGIFDQAIQDGWQVEMTDRWLRLGNPWEVAHPEITYQIKLGGHTVPYVDDEGRYCVQWVPEQVIMGTPFDMPILGYQVNNANLLRLWRAEACESFDFKAFNIGDYYQAVNEKVFSGNITKILYPNDEPEVGKRLRLEQQYFFVSCSLQDMIRIYLQREKTLEGFHRKYAVQLNDTHPSIAIPELMRLLIDEHRMDWDQAWEITTNTFAYTNHTLLPEALEKWPLGVFKRILPRHLEIIYEINHRFLETILKRYPVDNGRMARLSLIEEWPQRQVRMANLACVGSLAVNGVAKLHTELLQKTVLRDFYDLWPEKFSNKTNGVTPRRFLLLSNPGLSRLITRSIGDSWVRNMQELQALETLVNRRSFREEWQQVKLQCKTRLAQRIFQATGIAVDPGSMFDIQVKRIHEYKRQHLNILHVITLYNRLKKGVGKDTVPRTVLFGGKAAPGYYMAKLIIKLIHSVAEVINRDPAVNSHLKVIFFPDFNVKNAQWIYPAADLSEQISTAGTEASGTGNMKFSMNGALTIGTLDGANIEIRENVGKENFFSFGLTAEEVQIRKSKGYRPRNLYESNEELREAVDQMGSGLFSRGDASLFQPLIHSLLEYDPYMLLADYPLYMACQEKVSKTWEDQEKWIKASILNAARIGSFSSDHVIHEYCRDIWRVQAVPVNLDQEDISGCS